MSLRHTFTTVAIAAAALGFGGCGEAPLETSSPPKAITPARTVLYDCAGHAESHPSELVLACADAGDILIGMHWHGWGNGRAYADGYEQVKLCVPNCASGGTKNFAAIIDVSGLTLAGANAAYRELTVNLTTKHTGSRYIFRFTRYALARTGPQWQSQSR